MKLEDLEEIGFTRNEALVYYALLNQGLSSITPLVAQTKLHKQIIYDNLQRLMNRGLVSFVVKSNKKYFSITSPDKVIESLQEQKKAFEKKEQKARQLLPIIKFKYAEKKEKQVAQIYQGKQGIKSILEASLKQGEDIFVYGAEGKFKETFGPYFYNYIKRLREEGPKMRMIYNEKVRGKREKLDYATLRYIPQEFESPATTMLFGDTVAIIQWGIIPFAVLIESRGIAKSYQSYFQILWTRAKK